MSKVKAQSSNFPLTFILSPRSLCRNRRKRYVCHSERSEESRRISVFQPIDSTRFFTSFRMTDIAFPPITTQSLVGGEKGEGEPKGLHSGHPHPHPPHRKGGGKGMGKFQIFMARIYLGFVILDFLSDALPGIAEAGSSPLRCSPWNWHNKTGGNLLHCSRNQFLVPLRLSPSQGYQRLGCRSPEKTSWHLPAPRRRPSVLQ